MLIKTGYTVAQTASLAPWGQVAWYCFYAPLYALRSIRLPNPLERVLLSHQTALHSHLIQFLCVTTFTSLEILVLLSAFHLVFLYPSSFEHFATFARFTAFVLLESLARRHHLRQIHFIIGVVGTPAV